jgi:hypothetical protein
MCANEEIRQHTRFSTPAASINAFPARNSASRGLGPISKQACTSIASLDCGIRNGQLSMDHGIDTSVSFSAA